MNSPSANSWLVGSVVYGGVFVNVVTTIILGYSATGTMFRPTWVMLMPVVQLVLGIGLLLWCGRARANVLNVAIATLMHLAWVGIYLFSQPELVAFGTLDAAIHLGLPLAWLFAVGGLFIAPWCLRRRRFGILKAWLAVSTMLYTAESGCRLLEALASDEIAFALDLPQGFPELGNAEVIHIAAIGESSTLGHPYQPKFGFPQVFLWRLEQHYPGRKFVLHNLAVGGFNLRKAANELQNLRVRPHLLLIYSGHNEFYHDMHELGEVQLPWDGVDPWIEWSALFRRLDAWTTDKRSTWKFRLGQRELFDRALIPPKAHEVRLARFKAQCEELSRFCREQEITPIWFVPAASESGFEPNRSLKPAWVTQSAADELAREFQDIRQSDCETASVWYRAALERLPDFAEFHFRLAECLEEAGEFELARYHYGRALDGDGFPIRAQAGYRDAIRQTAKAADQLCIETGEVLRPYAPGRILGADLFHDNVHMTLKGYYLTGLAGAESLIESGRLDRELGPPQQVEPLTLGQATKRAGLDQDDLAAAYRLTAYGFQELKNWRYDQSLRDRQLSEYRRLAEALVEDQIAPGQDGAESLNSSFAP